MEPRSSMLVHTVKSLHAADANPPLPLHCSLACSDVATCFSQKQRNQRASPRTERAVPRVASARSRSPQRFSPERKGLCLFHQKQPNIVFCRLDILQFCFLILYLILLLPVIVFRTSHSDCQYLRIFCFGLKGEIDRRKKLRNFASFKLCRLR